MLDTYKKLKDLLDKRERRQAVIVFFLMFSIALVEVLGVASILPFIAVLSNPDIVDKNKYLATAYNMLGFTSIDSFMFFLGFLQLCANVPSGLQFIYVFYFFSFCRLSMIVCCP